MYNTGKLKIINFRRMNILKAFFYAPQYLFIILIITFLTSACQLTAPLSSEPTQLKPEEVFTAAAQTAEAKRLEKPTTTASPEAEDIINTSIAPTPTYTEVQNPTESIQQTAMITATTPISQPTNPVTPGGDKAKFVADVSVPDGSIFTPGEQFTKTWRLENIGDTTWTTEYAFVYIDGALMSESTAIYLSQEVAPYEKIEISVKMTAPTSVGNYRSFWKLRNAEGNLFGVGVDFNDAIWVDISVESNAASAESTPTKNLMVNDLHLTINNAHAITSCPYTFVFTGNFTLAKTTSVTYNLEFIDLDDSQIKIPLPISKNLVAGVHSVEYKITLSKDISGWARLSISEPEAIKSEPVQFELECT